MSEDPMPKDFGWRYILWTCWQGWVFAWKWIWAQAITILMMAQGIAAAITLDPTLVSHDELHYWLIGNAVMCAILAQIKREKPTLKPKGED